MARVRPTEHFTLSLEWDTRSKRWKCTWIVRLGRSVASHWLWIESQAPVDAETARAIARAVAQELESRLPW